MREIAESQQSLHEIVRPLLRADLAPCCAIAIKGNLSAAPANKRGTFRTGAVRSKRSAYLRSISNTDLNTAVCHHLTRSTNRTSLMELLTHLLLWAAFTAIASHFFGLFA